MLNRFSDRSAVVFILIYNKKKLHLIMRKPWYDRMINDWYYSSEYLKKFDTYILAFFVRFRVQIELNESKTSFQKELDCSTFGVLDNQVGKGSFREKMLKI